MSEAFSEALGQIREGKNPSGLEPVEYRVVVLLDKIEATTGILHKAQGSIEQDLWDQTVGYVVDYSDMAFTNEEGRWKCAIPGRGQKVLLAKHSGQFPQGLKSVSRMATNGDPIYKLVSDKDVLAVIEEE